LEGAAPATPVALPANIEAIVVDSLAVETLEQRSIAALVNLRACSRSAMTRLRAPRR
jgi:hypothetical protein